MTFFEHQHRARRRTSVLILYFALAILLITLAVNAVFFVAATQYKSETTLDTWLAGPYWIWITAGTLLTIFFGMVRTLIRLRGGGRAVAEMVGARLVSATTEDLRERRLLNVVEEMSIASGTPRPLVYVLEGEPGINAFVAGLRPTEAVLVVTRGALAQLNRDELQGVVGHEYSHILNGDMRLNVRLMGLLAGLLNVAHVGRFLVNSRESSSGRNREGGLIALVGFALFVIGLIGVFFGSLIQAAVSRQREFLADASSVQFTRNPEGIAGALYRILNHTRGSALDNLRSQDLSHFCFGDSVKRRFTSLLATHPPLEERIRVIDPTFIARARSGKIERAPDEPAAAEFAAPAGAAGFAGGAAAGPARAAGAAPTAAGSEAAATEAVAATPAAVAAGVGHVWPVHVAFAERLHARLPAALLDALHDPQQAPHVVFALVLQGMQETARSQGMAALAATAGQETAESAAALVGTVQAAGANARLVLINLVIPVLKERDEASRNEFLETLSKLVECDGRYTLFEFALVTILRQHLAADAERQGTARFFRYGEVIDEIRLLLTLMARAGAGGEEAARAAFRHVMAQFEREAGEPLPGEACTLPALERALGRLNALTPMLKKSVVEACADCVIHDGRVLPREAELLQAVALALDCPLPPLLQG